MSDISLNNVKELPSSFLGKGEVKEMTFDLIVNNEIAYVYRVMDNKTCSVRYEVFRRKINTLYNMVSYPKSNSFGIWAWTFSSILDAINKFNSLTVKYSKKSDEEE
jgi:hypothetical protein